MRSTRTTVSLLMAVSMLVGCEASPNSATSEGEASVSSAERPESSGAPSIAVSNAFFETAVRDLLGEQVTLVVLADPGMCPGHFDLRPSQVRQLRSCDLLVRFDFQQSLDSRLGETAEPPRVVVIRVSGGMCEPESYESACRQLAEAFRENGLLSHELSEQQLAAIARRMSRLSDWARSQVEAAGLQGAPILSSGHQAAFCRQLGLHVAGTFSAVDRATPGQIDGAVKSGEQAGVRFVIANLPEGRQLADALADRLHAKVVVFENFPGGDEQPAFDALVRRNVTALVEAAEQ